jgi:PST family polysaccharide transporter
MTSRGRLNLSHFFFGSPTRKKLFGNFAALSVLQAVSYLFPLLTLPYLVRVLGPEKFGLVAFAQAFIGYFVILTDYGFNLSATRRISTNRGDKEKVKRIFSSVMAIKLFFCLVSFAVLALVLLFVPKFHNDWLVYIYAFGMVLGNVMFPVWFFQGMERMKYITFLNIAAKSLFTVSIFIFVKKLSDYELVPLINSLGYIAAGLLSLRLISKDFGIKWAVPMLSDIKYQLSDGWHIFISTAATSLYTTSNSFILGLFTNNTIVGYYSAAEKLINSAQGLFGPLSQTMYPHLSSLARRSKKEAVSFIEKLTKLTGILTFILSFAVFIFAPSIIGIILGSQYQQSINVLKILSILPFMIGLSNIFVIQGLYAFELQGAVSRFVIPLAFLHLILSVILTNSLSLYGTAFAVAITETLVALFSVKYFFKYVKNDFYLVRDKASQNGAKTIFIKKK